MATDTNTNNRAASFTALARAAAAYAASPLDGLTAASAALEAAAAAALVGRSAYQRTEIAYAARLRAETARVKADRVARTAAERSYRAWHAAAAAVRRAANVA